MVFEDLSRSISVSSSKSELRVPDAIDRILAFMIDVSFFIPIFTILLAELLKKIQFRFQIDNPLSTEFYVFVIVGFVFVLVITIFIQTLFLIYFRTTPGKFLMKMKVVDLYQPEKKLTMTQAFLRSSIWTLEWLALGFPFFEILSHKMRRPLHDRAAETMVVTLKENGDLGPYPIESQIIRRILLVTSLIVLFGGVIFSGSLYKKAVRGGFSSSEANSSNYLCEAISQVVEKESRIDRAIALFLAGEVSEDCLKLEADFVLWSLNELEKKWGYLAKMLIAKFDKKDDQKYLGKICEKRSDLQNSEECQIGRLMSGVESLLNENWISETGKFLILMRGFQMGHYQKVAEKTDYFSKLNGYQEYLQKIKIKTLWSKYEHEKALGAYEMSRMVLNRINALDLSSWLCQEELDKNCAPDVRSRSCKDMMDQVVNLAEHKRSVVEKLPLDTTLAIIQEQECRGASDSERFLFSKAFESYPELQDYGRALSKDSVADRLVRLKLFKSLFSKEKIRTAIKEKALLGWISLVSKDGEIGDVIQAWKNSEFHTWSWMKAGVKLIRKALEIKNWSAAVEIAEEFSEPESLQYGLNDLRAMAYYQSGNSKKAWNLVKNSKRDSLGRGPASVDNFEFIKNELKNKYMGKSQ